MATQQLYLAELALTRAAANEAEAEAVLGEINTTLDVLRQEHMMMLSGAGDFAGNLGLVTDTLPILASFTSIEMDEEYILVEGIVDNPFAALNYTWDLEAEAYTEARIVIIDEVSDEEENTSTYYLVEITR
jgi:hypothetical protein